jgi:hypothetical protein
MTTKREGPFAMAATAFEAELSRYEELTAEATKGPISSEKTLARAKRQLGESAECELRLAEYLVAVIAAMEGARRRQEACMDQALAAAQRLQARSEEFVSFTERFSTLGLRAREVNEPVAAVVARKSEGAPATELLAGLRNVATRTEGIIADAEALARDAASADWGDITRAAESLKQQVQSARNRVLLAERMVSEQAPS